eukprot:15363098-Ditylum_brightwellii.AAC.1
MVLARNEEKPSIEYPLSSLRDLNDKFIFFSKDRRTKEIIDFMKIFELLFELMIQLQKLKELNVPLFSNTKISVCCVRGKEDICISFQMWEHKIRFCSAHKNENILRGDTKEEWRQIDTLRTISSHLSSIVISGWEEYMDGTRREFPILNQFSAMQLSRLSKLTALYCVPEYFLESNDGAKASKDDFGQDIKNHPNQEGCKYEDNESYFHIEMSDFDEKEEDVEKEDGPFQKSDATTPNNHIDPTLLSSKISKCVGIELQWLLQDVNQDLSLMHSKGWDKIRAA